VTRPCGHGRLGSHVALKRFHVEDHHPPKKTPKKAQTIAKIAE
jgi:hypothetical protein